MNDHREPEPRQPPRPWTHQEDETLAQHLAEGTIFEEIATRMGRSAKALRARARRMLPEDDPRVPKGAAAFGWLRAQLQHGYNWRGALGQLHPTPNAGDPWTWAENTRLIENIRAGLTWTQIAAEHGRTLAAVEAQAAHLVIPLQDDWPRKARLILLRELVADDPDYNWADALRVNPSVPFPFSPRDDEALRHGWQDHTPLPDLAAALRLSEGVIVRRLTVLGLGSGLLEITDRLGCTPGGLVEERRRLLLDPANQSYAGQTLVLIATHGSDIRHVSIHRDRDQAEEQAQQLTTQGLTPHIYPRKLRADPTTDLALKEPAQLMADRSSMRAQDS